MAKALMKVVMKLVSSVVDIVLLPINALISNIFPDFSEAISNFTSFVTNYVGGSIGYFASILPPITRSIVGLWLTFLVTYYGVSWSYSLIIKIYNVIHKIKFW